MSSPRFNSVALAEYFRSIAISLDCALSLISEPDYSVLKSVDDKLFDIVNELKSIK